MDVTTCVNDVNDDGTDECCEHGEGLLRDGRTMDGYDITRLRTDHGAKHSLQVTRHSGRHRPRRIEAERQMKWKRYKHYLIDYETPPVWSGLRLVVRGVWFTPGRFWVQTLMSGLYPEDSLTPLLSKDLYLKMNSL